MAVLVLQNNYSSISDGYDALSKSANSLFFWRLVLMVYSSNFDDFAQYLGRINLC